MSNDTQLTPDAVDDLLEKCLASNGDLLIDGIVRKFAFDPVKITEHAEAIGALLNQLPDTFQASKGGGWSFLQACDDRHGRQWTGLHAKMEELFCLGIAAGKAKWLLPRDLWEVLPGGMPYVAVLNDFPRMPDA